MNISHSIDYDTEMAVSLSSNNQPYLLMEYVDSVINIVGELCDNIYSKIVYSVE